MAEFLGSLWEFLGEMSPYLLFGFLTAGLLSVLIPARLVERHLGGHGFWPVFKASLFGVPLPLCSCSVIPVAASLRKHGASRGAATAFLISTPQTGADSILVTLSLLGPVFAVFKPIAALVSGLIGGAVVDVLEPHGEAHKSPVEECHDTCCAGEARRIGRLWQGLSFGFIDLPRDIGKALTAGVLLAGAIAAFVPGDFFVGVGSGVGAILVMMLLGIPVYVCSAASVPIAAALMLKGVSPGAALAFLMTGPATNAAGIATVWKIMGPRTAAVYLSTVAVTALGSGLILDYVFAASGGGAEAQMGWMLPPAVKAACAGALTAVLALSFLRRGPEHVHEEESREDEEPPCH